VPRSYVFFPHGSRSYVLLLGWPNTSHYTTCAVDRQGCFRPEGRVRLSGESSDTERALQTTYGRVLLGKLALVAALVGFGALNRSVILPRLSGSDPRAAGRAMGHFRWSLRAELFAAALLLAGVAAMTALPPSTAVWAEHQRLEPMQASTMDGVELLLRVFPGQVGSNSIAIDVTDSRSGASEVPGTVSLTVVGSPSQASTPPSERTNAGLERYPFLDFGLAAAGPTQFQVTLSRAGLKTVSTVITVRIAGEDRTASAAPSNLSRYGSRRK
jgi:Copper resistance protein D